MKTLRRIRLLAALPFLLPAILSAQTVNVTVNGVVSLTGNQIYVGQYVAHTMDYGFLWLDTVNLIGGFVGVLGRCGLPVPKPVTNLYTIGDCNGITNIGQRDGVLVVRNFNGQCGTQVGCYKVPPQYGPPWPVGFTVGSWAYLGGVKNVSDSGQQTDPVGRTWQARPVTGGDLSHYVWSVVGGSPTPPVASASAVNLSAQSRTGAEATKNYFGDKWDIKDASSSTAPLTNLKLKYKYTGAFDPPTDVDTPTLPALPAHWDSGPIYWPCDPANGGNVANGASCYASLGGNPGPYQFVLKTTNQYGSGQFAPTAIAVVAPQVRIAGFSGGTLPVLSGGSADASGSQGNINDPATTFTWTFTPGSTVLTGKVVTVPATATGFSLRVHYPGDYTAPTVSGAVSIVDLVPAFSLSPNPVLLNRSLTLTNQMQIGAGTTLADVTYTIKQGATVISSGTLAASFLSVGGSDQLTAPGTVGSYTVDLKYDFSGPHGSRSLTVSNPFTATNWTPNPVPGVYTNNTGTHSLGTDTPAPFQNGFQLQTGNTYYLWDDETIPNGIPHPGTAFSLLPSGTSLGSSTEAGPRSFSPSQACTSGCFLKATVGGNSTQVGVTISSPPSPPPPPPPPPTALSVSLSGPTSAVTGQSATFTANVSGSSGSVTYTWAWGDGSLPQTGGSSSLSHVYSAVGTYTVQVGVSSGGNTATAGRQISIAQGGPPAPSIAITVTGASFDQVNGIYNGNAGQPIKLIATETAATAYGWDTGDGPPSSGKTIVHTYANPGSFTVMLLVYGNGTTTAQGPNIGTYRFVIGPSLGPPLPSTDVTIAGATLNLVTGNYDAVSGVTLVFTASETDALNYNWDFGDGTPPAVGKTITHVYASTGLISARLLVYGDGTTKATGPATATIPINVTRSPFQAAIVPGAAHLDDGTTTWGTDVSITNAGASPMNINLAFLPQLPDGMAPPSVDLAQLAYGDTVPLAAGGSWSVSDVVAYLNGGNNKGTLVIKYSGGTLPPLVSARVYFAPKVNPGNISYGSGIPAYAVDAFGRISPQGFVSAALSGQQGQAGTLSTEALADTLTVNKTGTGTGTVTSDPAGIDCGSTCSASFTPSSTLPVTLFGQAGSGSVFVGWTSGCDYTIFGNQCVVTTGGSKTLTAQFDSSGGGGGGGGGGGSNATLTVSTAGTGSGTVSSSPAGISCGSSCSKQFAQGTVVTLSAAPASGSTFSGWSGACSGTGSCVVALSANASVTASFAAAAAPQGDQSLIGLRADLRYRFGVTLYNASGSAGTFRLSAMDEVSSPVLISDGAGAPPSLAYRDFTIPPYQQVYLKNDDLGLNDANRRYVLKATRTSATGTLLAFGTTLDRQTNDLMQISDDSQASPAEAGIVSYWVAGVSRYDAAYGAHWRTDLRIYNRGSHPRNLYFDYVFLSGGSEQVAHVNQVPIAPGDLLTYDDVVGSLLAQDASVDLSGSSAGILRIYYPEDAESATRPLIIGSRNYDDQPTGTAGSQLAVYTRAQSAGPGQKLYLTGAEESSRYSSRIGVFAMDPSPVQFRIVAVDPNGNEIGSLTTQLGGSGVRWGQLDLTRSDFNFQNPGKPVSIRIDQISGGRVAAYAFTVDRFTLDTNFIQALPQN